VLEACGRWARPVVLRHGSRAPVPDPDGFQGAAGRLQTVRYRGLQGGRDELAA